MPLCIWRWLFSAILCVTSTPVWSAGAKLQMRWLMPSSSCMILAPQNGSGTHVWDLTALPSKSAVHNPFWSDCHRKLWIQDSLRSIYAFERFRNGPSQMWAYMCIFNSMRHPTLRRVIPCLRNWNRKPPAETWLAYWTCSDSYWRMTSVSGFMKRYIRWLSGMSGASPTLLPSQTCCLLLSLLQGTLATAGLRSDAASSFGSTDAGSAVLWLQYLMPESGHNQISGCNTDHTSARTTASVHMSFRVRLAPYLVNWRLSDRVGLIWHGASGTGRGIILPFKVRGLTLGCSLNPTQSASSNYWWKSRLSRNTMLRPQTSLASWTPWTRDTRTDWRPVLQQSVMLVVVIVHFSFLLYRAPHPARLSVMGTLVGYHPVYYAPSGVSFLTSLAAQTYTLNMHCAEPVDIGDIEIADLSVDWVDIVPEFYHQEAMTVWTKACADLALASQLLSEELSDNGMHFLRKLALCMVPYAAFRTTLSFCLPSTLFRHGSLPSTHRCHLWRVWRFRRPQSRRSLRHKRPRPAKSPTVLSRLLIVRSLLQTVFARFTLLWRITVRHYHPSYPHLLYEPSRSQVRDQQTSTSTALWFYCSYFSSTTMYHTSLNVC